LHVNIKLFALVFGGVEDMIKKLFGKLKGNPKDSKSKIQLKIVSKNEKDNPAAKAHMESKIHELEDRTDRIDHAVHDSLEQSIANQEKLGEIEKSMEKMLELGQELAQKQKKQN